MDKCHKCGQTICQPGYYEGWVHGNQPKRVYTCSPCRKEEQRAELHAKYGWLWPALVIWNSILAVGEANKFSKTEVLATFVKGLGNETGLFEQKFSELAHKLHVRVEYINRGGLVELTLRGFKEYGDATIEMTINKFSLETVEPVSVQGDYTDIAKLTKSMTELLKSELGFEIKLCHC